MVLNERLICQIEKDIKLCDNQLLKAGSEELTISFLISGVRKAGSLFQDFLLSGATVKVAVIQF